MSNFSRSRHREEFAPWYCNRPLPVEPAVLAHAPVAVAARKALPVPSEMAVPPLKAARRRNLALNSNRAARHPANSNHRSSSHSRRKISNEDTHLTRTEATNAYPFYSPEWPRRRFDILSRREAELIATTSSFRGARATLPGGGGPPNENARRADRDGKTSADNVLGVDSTSSKIR